MFASDLLSRLDPEQQAAVTHLGSPALVLAGAGSGKTRTITYRVAYLVRARNVPPTSILAVTFTNKAAGEMRERLAKILGEGLKDLWVHTFHRACSRLLRAEGGAVGVLPGFTVADYRDQVSLLKRVMEEAGPEPVKTGADGWLARIGRLKDELVRPESFVPEEEGDDYLLKLYRGYQASLRRDNLLDFDDLLLETERLLREQPAVLEKYRRRFAHLLVDEFQDTNKVQYLIAHLLAGEGKGLFAVGDEDQSIYRWRGASPGNFRSFRTDYPGAALFLLERNYRSTPPILKAAAGIIGPGLGRTPKRLLPHRQGGEPVLLRTAANDLDEAAWVTGRIRGLLLSRAAPEEIAVLFRVNAQSAPLERALASAGIPYRLIGGTRFFSRQEVKDLLAYLRLALNPDDDPSFRRAVNVPPRGIGKATLEELERRALAEGLPLYRMALALATGGAAGGRKLGAFTSLVEGLAGKGRDLTPESLLDEVLRANGYEAWLKGGGLPDSEERLENVAELKRLLGEISGGAEEGLASFLDEVALLTDADESGTAAAVSLMTLHCAKGLEFPVVFIIGLEEGLLPHNRALTDTEELEEERRLCYVGFTRARDLLHLSWSRQRLMYGRTMWHAPSRFLDDIPPAVLRREEPTEEEEPRLPARAAARKGARREEDYSLGFQVRHPVFGIGTVLGREGEGEDLKLTVHFPGRGKKKLLVRSAGLLPVHLA